MATCPQCLGELPADSAGLVLCPHCGHPSFLDMDGNLQASSRDETPPVAEHVEAALPLSFFDDAAAVEPSPFPPMDESQNDTFVHLEPTNETVDITEYANSEFSQGKDGAFVYNVSIADIDSKEIRELLREAINDTRFNWDPKLILSQIKKGELLLKNLSPVKASILINRIKRLPVKIQWEQYAITQAEQDQSPS